MAVIHLYPHQKLHFDLHLWNTLMDPKEKQERDRVVAIARSWILTPYHHRSKVKGEGVDCAQIIAAVFEEAGLVPLLDLGDYPEQWFLHRDQERYVEYVLQYAREINQADAIPADMVIFKVGRTFAHGAIIVDPGWPRIVHAYRGARCVLESDGSIGPIGAKARRFFTRW
jgi:cell wall-associated NlpC family hydrolase